MTRPTPAGTTRIVIVDDHAIFREGLKMLLARNPSFVIAGEAGESQEALALASAAKPDIILLDVDLAGRLFVGLG